MLRNVSICTAHKTVIETVETYSEFPLQNRPEMLTVTRLQEKGNPFKITKKTKDTNNDIILIVEGY